MFQKLRIAFLVSTVFILSVLTWTTSPLSAFELSSTGRFPEPVKLHGEIIEGCEDLKKLHDPLEEIISTSDFLLIGEMHSRQINLVDDVGLLPWLVCSGRPIAIVNELKSKGQEVFDRYLDHTIPWETLLSRLGVEQYSFPQGWVKGGQDYQLLNWSSWFKIPFVAAGATIDDAQIQTCSARIKAIEKSMPETLGSVFWNGCDKSKNIFRDEAMARSLLEVNKKMSHHPLVVFYGGAFHLMSLTELLQSTGKHFAIGRVDISNSQADGEFVSPGEFNGYKFFSYLASKSSVKSVKPEEPAIGDVSNSDWRIFREWALRFPLKNY